MRLYRPDSLDACAFVRAEAGLLGQASAGEPGLLVAPLEGEAVLLGRHQRTTATLLAVPSGTRVTRRLGGGRAALVGRGSIGVALALPSADALADRDRFGPERVINRHVRGLLAGLGQLGTPARYLGRDSVRVGARAVALVSQDGVESGAVLFEAIVGAERAPVFPGIGVPRDDEEPWGALDAPAARVAGAIISGYAHVISRPLEVAGAAPEGPAPEDALGRAQGRPVARRVSIGRLEASVQLEAGRIAAVTLWGDLIAPAAWLGHLEAGLVGCAPEEVAVRAAVLACLERADAALLGVLPDDLVLAVLGAAAEQT